MPDSPNARFEAGRTEPPGETSSRSPTALCPACSAAVDAAAKFCGQCGASLTVRAPGTPLPPVSRPTRTSDQTVEPPTPAGSDTGARGSAVQVPAPGSLMSLERGCANTCECGRALPDDATFCPGCGKRQPDHSASGYWLVYRSPGGQTTSVPLSGPEFTIGKASGCGLVCADDTYLSRRHARLLVQGDRIVLEDLGSANGTFLRIRHPVTVEPGDEIVLGAGLLRLERRES